MSSAFALEFISMVVIDALYLRNLSCTFFFTKEVISIAYPHFIQLMVDLMLAPLLHQALQALLPLDSLLPFLPQINKNSPYA